MGTMIYLTGLLFGMFTGIMNQKPMYQYISELLDFADKISTLIKENKFEDVNYFMTLIYVEDIVDKYGRSLASSSARDTEFSEDGISAIRVCNNTRLIALRSQIRLFSEKYNFDQAMTERFQRLVTSWERRGQSSGTESDY